MSQLICIIEQLNKKKKRQLDYASAYYTTRPRPKRSLDVIQTISNVYSGNMSALITWYILVQSNLAVFV